jgi:hypothetical protein
MLRYRYVCPVALFLPEPILAGMAEDQAVQKRHTPDRTVRIALAGRGSGQMILDRR